MASKVKLKFKPSPSSTPSFSSHSSLSSRNKLSQSDKNTEKTTDGDNNSGGGVSSKQAFVYFAIVVACFVVVYPRMIHPMIRLALGFGGQDSVGDGQHPNSEYPPQMLHRGKPPPSSGAAMRPPPPGARGDHASADAGKGSGGGVMAMILPIYAGGLFLYLLYAASKAYKSDGSSNQRKDPHEETYALITERLSGLDLEKIVSGEDKSGASEINKLAEFLRQRNAGVPIDPSCIDELEGEDDEIPESVEVLGDKETSKSTSDVTTENLPSADDTDELLRKCESQESMTESEMLRLKSHLAQMEGRMNKLMSALHTVQSKTSEIATGVTDLTAGTAEMTAGAGDGEAEETLSDALADVSSVESDSVNEADRLEVQEVYDGISSSDEETPGIANDMESGGIRKRHFEVEDCSDEEDI